MHCSVGREENTGHSSTFRFESSAPFLLPRLPCRSPWRVTSLFNRPTFTLRGCHFPASPSINIHHLISAPPMSNCSPEKESLPLFFFYPAKGSPQTLDAPLGSSLFLWCSLPIHLFILFAGASSEREGWARGWGLSNSIVLDIGTLQLR